MKPQIVPAYPIVLRGLLSLGQAAYLARQAMTSRHCSNESDGWGPEDGLDQPAGTAPDSLSIELSDCAYHSFSRLQSAAMRRQAIVEPMFFLRYASGCYLGEHTDYAGLRLTVLLRKPVRGGQLHVDGFPTTAAAGDGVFIPSNAAHSVTPVERGMRLSIVCSAHLDERLIVQYNQARIKAGFAAALHANVRGELVRASHWSQAGVLSRTYDWAL